MTSKAITVSQLNSYVKVLFEMDDNLKRLFVAGEISNFKKHYASGHLYFSLKDEKSVIKAVMFAKNAATIPFDLSDGMKVTVRGYLSCYEISGQYQIYVQDIQPQGIGSVYLAFEQLKVKLLGEGLFDESCKKAIPAYPKKIGVITSRTGAVIHDIKIVIGRRYPVCEIILYPVEVQGEKSSHQIVEALRYFNDFSDVDVIIIGRGGGSIEELWPFNKEEVARAIFFSRIPIISAVGHETDVTICDFVADKRAATPSMAAEIATPDKENLKLFIKNMKDRIQKAVNDKVDEVGFKFNLQRMEIKKFSAKKLIDEKAARLSELKIELSKNFSNYLSNQRYNYEILKKRIEACSREKILEKGYAVILKQGANVKNVSELEDDCEVLICLRGGSIKCRLIDIQKV